MTVAGHHNYPHCMTLCALILVDKSCTLSNCPSNQDKATCGVVVYTEVHQFALSICTIIICNVLGDLLARIHCSNNIFIIMNAQECRTLTATRMHDSSGFHPERNFWGEVGVAVSRTVTPPPIKH